MKKVLFVFAMSLMAISFGNLIAQDASVPGSDPELMRASKKETTGPKWRGDKHNVY